MADLTLLRLLTDGAAGLGIALSGQQQEQLLGLVDELLDWNTRFNLTAIREPREVVTRHLLDSLSVQPHLHGRSAADIGTGAGFPGLPLAIVNPERQFALVEATGKKAKFVEHAAGTLGIGNAQVINARAENWRPQRPFDTVISRALGSLKDFVRFAGTLCAPGGRLLAMKGQYPEQEIAEIPRSWRVVAVPRLEVPGLEAQRHLVILQRCADVISQRTADVAAGSR
jgi:16S rRNA (guanine527-N7)-methyltransferase